jgi:hypothetical protein
MAHPGQPLDHQRDPRKRPQLPVTRWPWRWRAGLLNLSELLVGQPWRGPLGPPCCAAAWGAVGLPAGVLDAHAWVPLLIARREGHPGTGRRG